MRPIYYETQLVGNAQQFDIEVQSLLRAAGLDGAEVAEALNCDALNTLKIELATRGVTGLQLLDTDTEKACHYAIEDNVCSINVSGLAIGHYYVTIKAIYGTHTRVLCTIFFDVVTEADEHTEPIVIQMPVVSTIAPDMSGVALEATSQEIKAAIMPISDAAEAYNVGKTQLAAAITSKGVETSPTETYPEMAEKVNAISQETYEINGGEMYAKQLFGSLETPNYWNLYEVLAQLLSDGRLVNYGGILLAEYYKGYDSLALSGAGAGGAYVVSDLDENGQFKMYTSDITHTWATEFDGKGNRWVAYCFADEYHDFQITDTNTSPRSIFIGRKVGTITSLVNGRISQIVCPDGNEYTKFDAGTYSQNWDKRVVLRGIKNQTGNLISTAGSIESMYIEGDNITGYLFSGQLQSLASLIIKCNTINEIIFTPAGGQTIPLNFIHIDNADGRLSLSESNFGFSNSKKDFIITNTESFELYSSQLTSSANMSNSRVYLGYRTNDKTKTVKIDNGNPTWNELPDVELKAGWCKPLVISKCIGLTEANIYAHILQRLKQDEPDCGDGVTITLGATNLAKLTSAESVQLLDDLTNIYGYTFA